MPPRAIARLNNPPSVCAKTLPATMRLIASMTYRSGLATKPSTRLRRAHAAWSAIDQAKASTANIAIAVGSSPAQ